MDNNQVILRGDGVRFTFLHQNGESGNDIMRHTPYSRTSTQKLIMLKNEIKRTLEHYTLTQS